MGLGDRLKRLEGDKPPSCGSCPYERAPVRREVTRLVDKAGNEVGFEPDLLAVFVHEPRNLSPHRCPLVRARSARRRFAALQALQPVA